MALDETSRDQSDYSSYWWGEWRMFKLPCEWKHKTSIIYFTQNHKSVAREKVSGSPMAVGLVVWKPQTPVKEIHPIMNEIFQSGINWWTNWQTNIAIHRSTSNHSPNLDLFRVKSKSKSNENIICINLIGNAFGKIWNVYQPCLHIKFQCRKPIQQQTP